MYNKKMLKTLNFESKLTKNILNSVDPELTPYPATSGSIHQNIFNGLTVHTAHCTLPV